MSFVDEWQYRIENWSLYFQGGIRRGILIGVGLSVGLSVPVFFLGGLISDVYSNTWLNSNQLVINKDNSFVTPTFSETQVIRLSNGKSDLYATINNRTNETIGFYPYRYTVQVLNEFGVILEQRIENSYLLPGEVKFVVVNTSQPDATKLNIIPDESNIKAIQYNPQANTTLKAPNIQARNTEITELPDGQNLRVRILLKNDDIVFVNEVDILYILRDTRDSVIAIGTARFNGFTAGSERQVIVTIPKPMDRQVVTDDIRWSVNYLDPNSVI